MGKFGLLLYVAAVIGALAALSDIFAPPDKCLVVSALQIGQPSAPRC